MLNSACLVRKSLGDSEQQEGVPTPGSPGDSGASDTAEIWSVPWAEGADFWWWAAASRSLLPLAQGPQLQLSATQKRTRGASPGHQLPTNSRAGPTLSHWPLPAMLAEPPSLPG